MPSPYVRCRFGFFSTFDAFGRLALEVCLDLIEAADDAAEGGRDVGRDGGRAGGNGDVERVTGAVRGGAEVGKTLEIGARAFMRDDEVGIVSLRAAGFDDGVEGRVGGTLYSNPYNRLVVAVCAFFAFDDAVGVSYRAIDAWLPSTGPDPEPDAWA